MADYISREAASADECKHKIKTPFAKIIVGGTPEKPCYNILYFDPADGKCHIGFGSYCRDNVFRWLAEEFEITEPAADVEPVRYGNWNIRLADEMTLCLECSICGRKVDNIDLHHLLEAGEYGEACRRYTYCHCGSKMDLEV
mgnify:FL=1